MRNLFKVALALILGIVLGSVANMALVMLGPSLIAPPPGADMRTAEGIKAAVEALAAAC